MVPSTLVLATLSLAPVQVASEPAVESIDPPLSAGAVAQGVATRLRATSDDWVLRLVEDDAQRGILVRFTPPEGEPFERWLQVVGDDTEGRSRALAAEVSVVIDAYLPPPVERVAPAANPSSPEFETPTNPTRGWLAAGGVVSLGFRSPTSVACGATLGGGVWLVRDWLQPTAEIGWQRVPTSTLDVDVVSGGLGLAVGRPLGRSPVWLGGQALVRATWATGRAEQRAGAWGMCALVGVLAQLRWRWAYAGVRAGVELMNRPIRFVGDEQELLLDRARFSAGLWLGVVLPPR